jgi:indolepyruvate ferredoxin oxidoreductase
MTKRVVSLADKYDLKSNSVFITGVQALVRLLMMQAARDKAEGLNTAGFVSGYRGSPLGSFDFALWSARKETEAANVRFQPGLNEDLAATSVWGSQQSDIFGDAKYDGVFGMWYGKNPGVDRSGDVLKHANMAGTSKNGGVLAISGDDPGASSSTIPNQCEQAFVGAMMPILYPANVAEIIEFGLKGYAASRYSGLWVGMKTVADTLETTASIDLSNTVPEIDLPQAFDMPDEGVHGRWPDNRWGQDHRTQKIKLPAFAAFARENPFDRVSHNASHPRFGIAAPGKSWLDVCQAMDDLGIDQALAEELGLKVYKIGLVWPLETTGAEAFASGLEELFVVEERQSVIEAQFKDLTYHWPENQRPRIVGKTDEQGQALLPSTGETSAGQLAKLIGERLVRLTDHSGIKESLQRLEEAANQVQAKSIQAMRTPYFCAGCPHARSTRLPDGSRALAGIGCHSLSMWVPGSNTLTLCQMGGEGATWIGLEPYVESKHIFQNMGDGTYYHSGLLAIRAAIAAGSNITYKILYNSAVAMTGGQPVEGAPDVNAIAWQMYGEGVRKIVVVAEDPERHTADDFPPDVPFRGRDDMDGVMQECRDTSGVSVILFDQQCATEKRRDRKRQPELFSAPRVVINDLVCEGCGDCSAKSRCVAVHLKETPLGPKRMIDQSTCNMDQACTDGFCPSFVTLEGVSLRKPDPVNGISPRDNLPAPVLAKIDDVYDMVIAGVGGTGLITVGAIIGMAAHMESVPCSILDNTGLARKGGGVTTHVRLGSDSGHIHAARIEPGQAQLVLGGDVIVASGGEVLSRAAPGKATAIINSHHQPTSAHALDPDMPFPAAEGESLLAETFAADGLVLEDVTLLAERLFGDGIYANMLLLGMAFQRGTIPLAAVSLENAIELNGIAVANNVSAFRWGRQLIEDKTSVFQTAGLSEVEPAPESLAEIITFREQFLMDYQNTDLAARYRQLVDQATKAESRIAGSAGELSKAVARGYFKLLAYKDEYEVARLLSHPDFLQSLKDRFDGDARLHFNLAPPFLAHPGNVSGKRRFGAWLIPTLQILSKFKGLRGTAFDPFGYQQERRAERALIAEYETNIATLLSGLTDTNLTTAIAIAELPLAIRGYGHVKQESMAEAQTRLAELLQKFRSPKKEAA